MAAGEKDRAQGSGGGEVLDPQWFRTIWQHEGFRRMLEQMSAVILEVDEQKRIVYVTPNVESVSGHAAEALVGTPSDDLVHPDDLRLLGEMRTTPDSERQPITYRSRHKSGHWLWIETAGRTVFTAPDGTLHSVSFSRDVTQLKRAEDEVRESEGRYRTIVESSDQTVVESNPDGEIVFMTSNIERVIGYSPEEIAAHADFLLVHPDDRDRIRAEFDSAVERREPVRLVYRVLHKDGGVRWIESSGIGYDHVSGESHFLNVTRDVTFAVEGERKRRELEVRVQQAQRLESLGVMAGGVAHDFNNLLTPVLADASLALADLPVDSPARPRLERIQRTAQHAAELTRQMLAYAGAGEVESESIDLSALVEETSQLLETGLGERAELRYELASELPLVLGDPGQLMQVALNLLTNATESMGPDGGSVVVRTGVMALTGRSLNRIPGDVDPGRYVFLEVEDDGCGMDTETRRRIFDPFFTTKLTGRGLGLASVLGILRAHCGAIEIDSEIGHGTTFKVLLPMADIVSTPQSDGIPHVEGVSFPRSTVLVIDDDEGTRDVAGDCLMRAGISVLLAPDGAAGLELFKSHADEIDVVVLDRAMPGITGEETFDRIRAIKPDIRILLISGYTENSAAAAFAGRNFSAFISKPFLPEELLASVSGLIAEAR